MHSGGAASCRRCWDETTGPPLPGQKLQTSTAGPIARRRPNGMRARVT